MLDIRQIQEILPHRYPFLLVDKIIETTENKIVGIKNVTCNEPFFQGHFPGKPIMPGVLIVEAMAQVAAVYALTKPENKGKIALFAGIDNCRFKRQVTPGDQLRIEVEVVRFKGSVGKCLARTMVEDQIVCEAELLFVIER